MLMPFGISIVFILSYMKTFLNTCFLLVSFFACFYAKAQRIHLPQMETRWMTYVDGGLYDNGFGISNAFINKEGKIDMVGFGTPPNGNPVFISEDAYISQLSPDFGRMVISQLDTLGKLSWGSYFSSFLGNSIIDSSDNILVGGWGNSALYSQGLIISPESEIQYIDSNILVDPDGDFYNANQTDINLIKVSNDGQLLWGILLGGKGFDEVKNLSVDSRGNIYISGQTSSLEGIATSGAIMPGYVTEDGEELLTYINPHYFYYSGPRADFLVKYNASGQKQWGTYLSRAQPDTVNILNHTTSIKNDAEGNLIIAGVTARPKPELITAGAQYPDFGCDSINCHIIYYLAKFNPDGELLWGTYYPASGTPNDGLAYGYAQLIVKGTDIYLTGRTSTPNLATPGAFQEELKGPNDIFIAKFNASGQRQWHTYLGGPGSEVPTVNEMPFAKNGGFYISGLTTSQSQFADSPSVYNPNKPGGNTFISKFNFEGNSKWTYYTSPETTAADFFISNDGKVISNSSGKLYQYRSTRAFDAQPLPDIETIQPNPTNANYGTIYLTMLVDTSSLVIPIDTTDTNNNPIDTPIVNLPINLYPNPNNGNFIIEGSVLAREAYAVNIYNTLGQLVFQQKLVLAPKHYFYLRNRLAKGAYFLRLASTNSKKPLVFKVLIE